MDFLKDERHIKAHKECDEKLKDIRGLKRDAIKMDDEALDMKSDEYEERVRREKMLYEMILFGPEQLN